MFYKVTRTHFVPVLYNEIFAFGQAIVAVMLPNNEAMALRVKQKALVPYRGMCVTPAAHLERKSKFEA